MPLDSYDLNPRENGWELKKRGAARATRTFDRKNEALDFVESFFDEKQATVRIRKRDGTFQEERTYPRSRDPRHRLG